MLHFPAKNGPIIVLQLLQHLLIHGATFFDHFSSVEIVLDKLFNPPELDVLVHEFYHVLVEVERQHFVEVRVLVAGFGPVVGIQVLFRGDLIDSRAIWNLFDKGLLTWLGRIRLYVNLSKYLLRWFPLMVVVHKLWEVLCLVVYFGVVFKWFCSRIFFIAEVIWYPRCHVLHLLRVMRLAYGDSVMVMAADYCFTVLCVVLYRSYDVRSRFFTILNINSLSQLQIILPLLNNLHWKPINSPNLRQILIVRTQTFRLMRAQPIIGHSDFGVLGGRVIGGEHFFIRPGETFLDSWLLINLSDIGVRVHPPRFVFYQHVLCASLVLQSIRGIFTFNSHRLRNLSRRSIDHRQLPRRLFSFHFEWFLQSVVPGVFPRLRDRVKLLHLNLNLKLFTD